MGLDMYLTKEIYIGAEYAHRKVTGAVDIQINGELVNIQFNKIQSIIEKVGYWRKANAIHQWFVDNVQEGEDDCKKYEVSCGQLTKLLQDVTKVLEASQLENGVIENGQKFEDGKWLPIFESGEIIRDSSLAEEILPTARGFFFGSTDYDQYYYEDLEYTKELLEEILSENSDGEFYYQSSW